MKNCPNCNKAFSKGQVIRSKWFGYYKLKCSNCGAQYEHTFKDRLVVALIPTISFFSVYLIAKLYNLSFSYYLLIIAGIFAVLVAMFISRGFKYERTN